MSPVVNKQLAIAEGEYRALEERKKILLYSITISSEGKSMAEKEAIAYASKDYQEFIEGLNIARKEYLKAKANIAALADKKDTTQSMNKLLVEELKSNQLPNVS